jgi:hypothetical protein
MELLELCQDRTPGVYSMMELYERATLGIQRCDTGLRLWDKSRVTSALQVTCRKWSHVTIGPLS